MARFQPGEYTPKDWDKACAFLSAHDDVMAELIARYAPARPHSVGNPFLSMLRALVGQQISVKAADAVWGRLENALQHKITPQALSKLPDDVLRGCGLSGRKVEYARTLQSHFWRRNDWQRWHAMNDDDIVAELTNLRGVGRWTAEMFLIFCVLHLNVLPVDDIGLLKAIGQFYHGGVRPNATQLAQHRARWHPYNTVATWHLWRALDPVPVQY